MHVGGRDMVEARVTLHDKNVVKSVVSQGAVFHIQDGGGKDLMEHLDEFNKLIVDLENIDVKYSDEDQALVLLYSLPRSYEHMVDILQYGREEITLDEVVGALKSKEHKRRIEMESTSGYSLFMARVRSDK